MIRIFSRGRRPRTQILRILAAGLIAFLFAALRTRGQTQPAPAVQTPIRATTELARLDVSVLDRHGSFIGGMAQKDFRVLDGASQQPIVFFASVEAPAQVLVLVETSPAVYLIHHQHFAAAYALLEGLSPDDQVALVSYDQGPHPILPFTPDKPALAAALNQLQYTLGTGELNFFDSISAVVDWLAPVTGKKSIVILSTGLDSSPPSRWDALAQKLRSNDVVIFPVALGGSLRQPSAKKQKTGKNSRDASSPSPGSAAEPANPLSFAKADTALLSLAKITGGHAYFPVSPNEFEGIYREIAAALRHQYVLGITPAQDGRFHALTVQVIGPNGQPVPAEGNKAAYRIIARQGYLAPGPQP